MDIFIVLFVAVGMYLCGIIIGRLQMPKHVELMIVIRDADSNLPLLQTTTTQLEHLALIEGREGYQEQIGDIIFHAWRGQ